MQKLHDEKMELLQRQLQYVPTLYGLFFLIAALLGYNSQTMQFSQLKCRIQWFLVYSQSCVTITTIISEYFITP